MSEYVIKSWKASNQAVDADANYVAIDGRAAGFLGWLLSLLRISPTVSLRVSATRVQFSQASLSGDQRRLIPLGNVCSSYFGYFKPWRAALAMVVFGIVFALGLSQVSGVVAGLLAFLIFTAAAVAYYLLNKSLALGFVENSGHTHVIVFRRSLIEQQNIDETSARYVCELVQALIESRGTAA